LIFPYGDKNMTEEKQKNISYEEKTLENDINIIETLKEIKNLLKDKSYNFIQTYILTGNARKTLNFHNDTGNTPIRKICVIQAGAGLTLFLNNNDGIIFPSNSEIDNLELNRIEYISESTATIMLLTRI